MPLSPPPSAIADPARRDRLALRPARRGGFSLIEVMIGEASPIPPQLIGLVVSALGMVAGSLLPQWVGHKHPQAPGFLHEHAAHPHSPSHHQS